MFTSTWCLPSKYTFCCTLTLSSPAGHSLYVPLTNSPFKSAGITVSHFFSLLPSTLKYLYSVEPVRMHFPAKQPCTNDTVCNAACSMWQTVTCHFTTQGHYCWCHFAPAVSVTAWISRSAERKGSLCGSQGTRLYVLCWRKSVSQICWTNDVTYGDATVGYGDLVLPVVELDVPNELQSSNCGILWFGTAGSRTWCSKRNAE